MELVLTGLDIEEKAKIFTDTLFNSVGGREQFDEVSIHLDRNDKDDPNTNEEAMAALRINVKSKDKELVGRLFSAKIIELALSNYPGFFAGGGVKSGGPVLIYWPALVDSKHINEVVHFNGKSKELKPTSQLNFEEIYYQTEPVKIPDAPKGETSHVPLGTLFGARSGDKGGCANLGVWAKDLDAFAFLSSFLTIEKLKELMPDLKGFKIERFDLPNILSLNFYIHDILEDGVSSNSRKDAQAKSLGEYLRAKKANIPSSLLETLNEY